MQILSVCSKLDRRPNSIEKSKNTTHSNLGRFTMFTIRKSIFLSIALVSFAFQGTVLCSKNIKLKIEIYLNKKVLNQYPQKKCVISSKGTSYYYLDLGETTVPLHWNCRKLKKHISTFFGSKIPYQLWSIIANGQELDPNSNKQLTNCGLNDSCKKVVICNKKSVKLKISLSSNPQTTFGEIIAPLDWELSKLKFEISKLFGKKILYKSWKMVCEDQGFKQLSQNKNLRDLGLKNNFSIIIYDQKSINLLNEFLKSVKSP